MIKVENKLTESAIEKFAIELLARQGFEYVCGPDIAPDSETPEREKFEDVILLERLPRRGSTSRMGETSC